ncbi:hypothetical protein [Amycolatopsis nigrescens]|uniref:hypothetical protein n=1 Tax=Amycolatopsis nigrescens TaxID=381445 RepID=UPI00035D05F4|nr:hypothetical protein [Amycolatopsis nigrescens]
MSEKDIVRRLLNTAGRTFAAEAGIRLTDKPAPLYRLLVLSVLLSTRIKADIAVDAARELHQAGLGTPRGMAESGWQERVDALGRAHYKRYDEQTATALGKGAELLRERYSGDLRKMWSWAERDPDALRELLTEVPRLGPVGADIFCREAQQVWPELRPHLDKKALQGAERIGLPGDPDRLVGLVDDDDLAVFAAALVRVALNAKLAKEVA